MPLHHADVLSPILSLQDVVEAFSAAIDPVLVEEKNVLRLDRKFPKRLAAGKAELPLHHIQSVYPGLAQPHMAQNGNFGRGCS